jgi:hypothetical protein
MDVHAELMAAFPWFDEYRWAWAFDPNGEGSPAYRIRPEPPGARGTIEIFMPTATHEQSKAVTAWLYRTCRPMFELPATRFLMEIGDRSRTPKAEWSHLTV